MKALLTILQLFACERLLQAAEPSSWEIQISVEMVALSIPDALRLLPRLHNQETIGQAEKEVQALVLAGKADLLGCPALRGLSGQRSVTEAFLEVRYPSEFEPPQIAVSVGRLDPAISRAELPHPFQTVTAFDTRNTGPMVEAEFECNPLTAQILLNLSARFTRLEPNQPTIGSLPFDVVGPATPQPWFTTLQCSTKCTVPNPGDLLLSSFVVEKPARHIVIFLLHATAHR